MDIIIVAHFCMDFSQTDNGRFSYLARMLSNNNDVEIITSDFFHTAKKYRESLPELPYKVTLLHEPKYKKNISLKRFFCHYIWGKNVEKYLSLRKKPDVIYCAVPSLSGPKRVAKYCNDNGIRFVIDIQDLWPEAFQMIFNIPFLFLPFSIMANTIYKKADSICAVSETYVNRALKVNKKSDHGTTVFLGTDLALFDSYSRLPPIINKNSSEVWIAYCGTLGSSYDLTCVFDAMALLNYDKQRVSVIIMGDGPKKKEFEEYANSRCINAVFTGRLPYNQMCSLLCRCDITVNPITHLAAQSIINKHADYAASGLPVVSTQENNEYRKLILEYQMGFNVENHNHVDLSDKLKMLIENEKMRKTMGQNARRCAEERFDRAQTYQLLLNVICEEKR